MKITSRKSFKQVALGVVASLTGSVLMAAPMQFAVTATADNDFLVVHSQGNTHNVVFRSQDRDKWRQAQDTRFEVKIDSLKECSIDIIAWNDHRVKEGLAAVVNGNAGSVHSGSPQMRSFATKIPNQANWANNNYPSSSQVNTIMNTLIPNSTHVHGVVGSTAPWGAVAGLSAPTKWIWAANALMGREFGKNFTVYRTACGDIAKMPVKPVTRKGMTWRKTGVDAVTGVVDVGCGNSGQNECNPYQGDTMCTTALPVLCKREFNDPLPKPASVTIPNKYHKWSGNIVGTTRPVAPGNPNAFNGAKLDELGAVNAFCAAEFGDGWKVASFHDGWAWYFKAYGNIGTNAENGRFWVNIKDQANGNCWSQQQ